MEQTGAPRESRPARVRPARVGDVASIAAIYEREVRTGTATFDTEAPPAAYWTDRLASTRPGHHVLVAEVDGSDDDPDGGEVLGFAYSSNYRPRRAYDHTVEVTVYLAPRAQGRGLGRALYDDLLARLRADGVHTALAVLAVPNPASEALHRACGFTRVGVLPEVGWKQDRWIDTAFWALLL